MDNAVCIIKVGYQWEFMMMNDVGSVIVNIQHRDALSIMVASRNSALVNPSARAEAKTTIS